MTAAALTDRQTYVEYHRVALDAHTFGIAKNILMSYPLDKTDTIDTQVASTLQWVARRIKDTTGSYLAPEDPRLSAIHTDNTVFLHILIIKTTWINYAVALPSYPVPSVTGYTKHQFLQRYHFLHTPRGDDEFSDDFKIRFSELQLGTDMSLRLSCIVGSPHRFDPRMYPPLVCYAPKTANKVDTATRSLAAEAPEGITVVEPHDALLSDMRNIGEDISFDISTLNSPMVSTAMLLHCKKPTSQKQADRNAYKVTDPWAV